MYAKRTHWALLCTGAAVGPAEETGENASPGESRQSERRFRDADNVDMATALRGLKQTRNLRVLRLTCCCGCGIRSGYSCRKPHGRGGGSLFTSGKLPGWPFTGLLCPPHNHWGPGSFPPILIYDTCLRVQNGCPSAYHHLHILAAGRKEHGPPPFEGISSKSCLFIPPVRVESYSTDSCKIHREKNFFSPGGHVLG